MAPRRWKAGWTEVLAFVGGHPTGFCHLRVTAVGPGSAIRQTPSLAVPDGGTTHLDVFERHGVADIIKNEAAAQQIVPVEHSGNLLQA
jgi:hypothetical protein